MFKHDSTEANNLFCSKCKGSCLRKTSADTQKAAKARFGIIPNNCVADSKGNMRCPFC